MSRSCSPTAAIGVRSWRSRGTACCRRSTRRHGARRPRNGWMGRRPRAACCGTSASRSRVPSAPGSTGGPCSTAGASACPCSGTVCRSSSAGDFSATCGPYWDVHRHRMAPEIAGQIKEMQASGQLEVRAGTIEAYQACHEGIAVRFRNRGQRRRDPGRRRLAGQLRRPDARLPPGPRAADPRPAGPRPGAARAARARPRDHPRPAAACGATGARTAACSRSGR